LGLFSIHDIIFYPPSRYIDFSNIKKISNIILGESVSIQGKVISVNVKKTRRMKIGEVTIYDGSGTLTGVWFNQEWIKDAFRSGQNVIFSGKITFYNGYQIQNPEYEIVEDEDIPLIHTGRILPIYRLTKGISQRVMRSIIYTAIKKYLTLMTDPLQTEELKRFSLIGVHKALENLHFPENPSILRSAIKRLAFDEIFGLELYLKSRKKGIKRVNGISFNTKSKIARTFFDSLPFSLTKWQIRALKEILDDMSKPHPMNRLLQGDVGSGKTIVALIASLVAIDNDFNVAFMAPTEILAWQHYYVIKEFLKKMDIPVYLLVGGTKKSTKEKILNSLIKNNGIIVGTHALLQSDVKISDIGLVIIDEQHRFGVLQREALISKGENPDVLFLTATPIPRTLALSVYGDLDVSTIDKMPPGRIPPVTRWANENKRDEIYKFVRNQVMSGQKAYIVLPLIEESEKVELKAAKKMYEKLRKTYFKDISVGLLYGRMKNKEKEETMKRFRSGDVRILISTTVIEVGVDVREANVMVIENADRFGLSQLHQLRGRIGRGGEKSYCILITEGNVTEEAGKRLRAMEKYTDGFKLSEIDLKIRGPGQFFGTRQHGFSDFQFFDIFRDRNLLSIAREFAEEILSRKDEKRFLSIIKRIEDRGNLVNIA